MIERQVRDGIEGERIRCTFRQVKQEHAAGSGHHRARK